jgi:hypothetical protein
VEGDLHVNKLGGENSSEFKLTTYVTINWKFNSTLPPDDPEARRVRLEERERSRRWLEFLAEEIRRTQRARAEEQRRSLTLAVEDPSEP